MATSRQKHTWLFVYSPHALQNITHGSLPPVRACRSFGVAICSACLFSVRCPSGELIIVLYNIQQALIGICNTHWPSSLSDGVLLRNCFLSGVRFFKTYGQLQHLTFQESGLWSGKLEIAEDMIFTCNNNYSEHIRHILQHTGVIWNFYGIFQQRHQEVA